jgi:filamentous hemagglutinin family protein
MKRIWHLSLLTGTNILYLLSSSMPSRGQITPDGTLPTNVNQSGEVTEITGGAEVGNNLFHSFQSFSVPTGSEAFFNNADNISNIINRVTGGSVSDIDGLIRANGSANLFLLNPAGIVFGPNASLNIGGSFLGSTADSLVFPDGIEFSATNNLAKPLLTINAPIGLRFRDNLGTIVNSSVVNPDEALEIMGSPIPAGLQVLPEQTFALIGGDIQLEGGIITGNGGNIELGSVSSNSLVNINPKNSGWTFGYDNVRNFQNIQLTTAIVGNAGIGSAVNIRANQISLTDGSQIFSVNLGDEAAEALTVNAIDSITITGTEGFPFPVIATATAGNGAAADLIINTKNLSLSNGGSIASLAGETGGASGAIRVKASDSTELIGTSADGENVSLISTIVQPEFIGDGKNVTIDTGKLIIKDGAELSARTNGAGKAGNLTINAKDIEIIGESADGKFGSNINAAANPGSTGDAGNLTINTERLTALDGGQVASGTVGSGKAGDLTINASDFIKLSGTSPILANLVRGNSGLFTSAEQGSSGDGGNLVVNTKLLTIEKGARISADTFGTGKAGNVTLNVDRLIVSDGGLVRAGSLLGEDTKNTLRGDGGTLTINANDSVQVIGTGKIGTIPVNSSLFTQAEGTGNAGNLNIFTPNLTVKDGAEINLSATGTGQAGNLKIESNNTQLDRGTITAATANGEGGNISLKAKDLLLLRNSSKISAQATGEASGGNINIDSQFIVAKPNQNNDIIANAQRGKGGNISIATEAIFGLEERKATSNNRTNDIDASSDFGLSGNVSIETPDVNPSKERVQPPENVVEPEELAAQACSVDSIADNIENDTENTFTITGRGGMPHDPTEPLRSEATIIGGVSYPQELNQASDRTSNDINSTRLIAYKPNPLFIADRHIDPNEIVPARGAIVNEKGQVVLTPYPTDNIAQRNPKAIDCLGKMVN